jgi:predicted HAD superfamily hydrolase
MSKGFEVEIEMPSDDIKKLLKQYKKVKKYQKSSIFAVKTMDGTEEIVSKMIEEAQELGPLD